MLPLTLPDKVPRDRAVRGASARTCLGCCSVPACRSAASVPVWATVPADRVWHRVGAPQWPSPFLTSSSRRFRLLFLFLTPHPISRPPSPSVSFTTIPLLPLPSSPALFPFSQVTLLVIQPLRSPSTLSGSITFFRLESTLLHDLTISIQHLHIQLLDLDDAPYRTTSILSLAV